MIRVNFNVYSIYCMNELHFNVVFLKTDPDKKKEKHHIMDPWDHI